MSKYQKALDSICGRCFKDTEENKKVLQEIVDKATPKRPYYLNYGGYQIGNWKCPSCDSIGAIDEYCKHCGQKLDWSDKDE